MDGSAGPFAPDASAATALAVPLDVLEDQITELSAHLAAATCRLLELIAEFDRRGGWSGPGLRSCAHWLNWKCGLDLGAAREKLRVAHALPGLPLIRAAFAGGEVSYSKVRAMTRVATPANESALLNVARHGTAHHVERLVRGYRRVQRLEDARRAHAERFVAWHQDEDGSWVIRGRLPAEAGALVVRALEGALETVREQERAAAPDAGAVATDLPPDADPAAPASAGARRADALALLAETFLAQGPGELAGGERYQVAVHVAAETLRGGGSADTLRAGDGLVADPGPATLLPGPGELAAPADVSAETCRRIACDCSRVHIVADADGLPLDVGRRTRSIPPAIHRALRRRDGGCRFPGCTCTRFVDAHHVRHWADGGETRLGNLVLLCRFHHRLVHEGGFGVRGVDDGAVVFTRPDGGRVADSGEARRVEVDGGRGLAREHHRRGLEIGPSTAVPRWAGEGLDEDLAVEALLACDRRADPPATASAVTLP